MTHVDEKVAYLFDRIEGRMQHAYARYGDFASTHEALGVAMEEWDELRSAICLNDQSEIEREALDLAAVLIRLAWLMRTHNYQHERSMK